ncbi:hypothetical protein M413DRAFT_276019 [Hebeloma cylindrosporum]|uniref:Uncharacterized protein n=1 Tax=Hebeloma cylindrosporum TaxID=76867 RepID=A0A0C2XHA8_HEBCY|nr:hypothetical protein M413DRAFT_276019 [Hebeloma cylindrosporum h7]
MASLTHGVLNIGNHVQIRLEKHQHRSLRSLKVRLVLEAPLDIPFDIFRRWYPPSRTKLTINAGNTTSLAIGEIRPDEIANGGWDTIEKQLLHFLRLARLGRRRGRHERHPLELAVSMRLHR